MIRTLLALTMLALVASLAPTAHAAEGRFTPRFREHYDLTQLRTPAGNTTYGGLSSSVNLIYEKPLEWSLGLVFNPVVAGRDKQLGTANLALPSKIRIWHYGIEYQRFVLAEPEKYGLFARVGASFDVFDVKYATTRYGGSYYLGLGWEQRVGGVGIAPEVAFRHMVFEKNIQALAFTPSLALRLYFINEWLEGL